MSVDKEILDLPKCEEKSRNKFKNRVPSDLMIVIGVLHLLLGVLCVVLFFSVLVLVVRLDEGVGAVINFELFSATMIYRNFTLVFGIVLIIGGLGLIRHKIRGWKFALGTSVFGVLLPALKVVLSLFFDKVVWTVPNMLIFVLLVLFGGSFAFLLSKTIRNFFNPRTIDYGIAGGIALILSLDFLVPFLFG